MRSGSVVVRITALLLAHSHGEDRVPDGNQSADEAYDQQSRERNEHQIGGGPRDEIDPLVEPVSYTHLDVYKRQHRDRACAG